MMKQLNRELQSVVKGLRSLTQKADKIAKRLEKLEKEKPGKKIGTKKVAAKKPVKKAGGKTVAKKGKRVTATDTVLKLILNSKKGVDTATLKRKTGFEDPKIRVIIYRLKKQGEIKSERRGLYVKA